MNERIWRKLPESIVTPLAEIDDVVIQIEEFEFDEPEAVLESNGPVVHLVVPESAMPPLASTAPPNLLDWADANPFVQPESEKKAA